MLTALRNYATPPSSLAGRLSVQSLLFATGEGAFLAGSAVYFGVILGLSLGQVGIGLTVAAIASFLAAVPAGKLVDRFGPKRMWSLSAVLQGALFLAWPFIDSFPQFIALAVVMEVAGSLGGAAHGAYVLDVLPPGERVESRAYMYSALNVGFSLGAFLGGGAIAFGADVLRWAPVVSTVLFVVNAVAILRLPDASHDVRSTEPRRQPEGPPAIRNRSWLLVTFLTGVRRRGDYQGVSELGNTLGRFWAPAVYGFLAMEWGAFGWLTIAAIVGAAAAAMHPATRAGRRYLEKHVPPDVLADARAGAPEEAPPPPTTLTDPLEPGTTVTDTPLPR